MGAFDPTDPDSSPTPHDASRMSQRLRRPRTVSGGCEARTTCARSGNGVYALMCHPAQWQRLLGDPSLIPTAVHYCLGASPSRLGIAEVLRALLHRMPGAGVHGTPVRRPRFVMRGWAELHLGKQRLVE